MLKKMSIPALLIILTACNNASNDTNATNDSANKKMSQQDTTHSMNMTSNVPELPAVPEGAKVFFKNLKNNAIVSSPLKVEMGISNIRIDTAGPVVAGSGHHHLFIDAEDSLPAGKIVPKDSSHLHFGKGQTFVDSLKLAPGTHKLTLQFADGLHRSYGSKLATTINVNVKK